MAASTPRTASFSQAEKRKPEREPKPLPLRPLRAGAPGAPTTAPLAAAQRPNGE